MVQKGDETGSDGGCHYLVILPGNCDTTMHKVGWERQDQGGSRTQRGFPCPLWIKETRHVLEELGAKGVSWRGWCYGSRNRRTKPVEFLQKCSQHITGAWQGLPASAGSLQNQQPLGAFMKPHGE